MRKKTFTRQVGVLFSDDTYSELIRITDEIEISLSEFIRQTSPNSRYLIWQRCRKQFNRVVSGTIWGKIGQ